MWIIITSYIYLELSREKVGKILWHEELIIKGILQYLILMKLYLILYILFKTQ